MSMQLAIRKKLYLLKGRFKAYVRKLRLSPLQYLIGSVTTPKQLLVYHIKLRTMNSDFGIELKVNSLSDLLAYDQTGSDRTRWEFLEEAMRRLERGDSCYTWSESGLLLACTWLRAPKRPVGGEKQEDTDNAELEGFYCHKSAISRLEEFIGTLINKVGKEAEQENVYCWVHSRDKILCQVFSSFMSIDDKVRVAN